MQLSQKPTFLFLALLISFGSVSAVLLTPALPAIGQYFGVTENATQLTITLFLVGYAIGQLLYGPLANGYGRKKALYIGIGMEIFASGLCLIAGVIDAFWLLVAGRLLMALGASVGLKMSFTLIADSYSQAQATKLISQLMTAFAIAPALGIALGGFATEHLGWQSCFYLLALYGILIFYLSYHIPETASELDLEALKFRRIADKYGRKIKNSRLVICALLMGCGTAVVYTFAALAPFIAMHDLGLSPNQYGLWNLLPPIGILIGSQISAWLANRSQAITTIMIGLAIMALGILLLGTAILRDSFTTLWLFIPMLIIYIGQSFIFANASILATSTAQDKASASAMSSFLNMGMATLVVLGLGISSSQPLTLLVTVFLALLGLAILLSIYLLANTKAVNTLDETQPS